MDDWHPINDGFVWAWSGGKIVLVHWHDGSWCGGICKEHVVTQEHPISLDGSCIMPCGVEGLLRDGEWEPL